MSKIVLDSAPKCPRDCPFFKPEITDGYYCAPEGCKLPANTSGMCNAFVNVTVGDSVVQVCRCDYLTTSPSIISTIF